MGSWWHLSRRFFGSLLPGGPPRRDLEWVGEILTAGELALWGRMYGPDRRHSARVARQVQARLGPDTPRTVLAAALLHDVGKLDSGLRTWGRVVATLSAKLAGADSAALWRKSSGFTRSVGLYLHHPDLGGDMLSMVGSDPLVCAWAREHHLPPDSWTVERRYAEVLSEVDDD